MEESVALDSSNQKKFVKSIRGIKKLIKKTGKVPKPNKTINPSPKTKKRRTLRKRGLVYLSHIPHGFYEHEMTEYFKQFGKVTNCRVIRSKKTGASKGFAFIEFSEPAVAQIVAETMNNYLMGKRLLKAECIPPEKQRRHAMRKNWNQQNNPGNNLKLRLKKAFNETKTDEQDLKIAKKILANLNQTKKKLMAAGIDYDFFLPVDVPQELANKVEVKSEPAPEKPKDAAKKVAEVKTKENKVKEVKSKDTKVAQKAKEVSVKPNEKESKKAPKDKESKKATKEDKTKETKAAQKALGVKKPLESFIKMGESDSDGDSDGSLVFDSDEFEQLQEFDEEFESGDEASGSDDDDDDEGSEEESSEDESPPPAKKAAANKKGAKPAPKPQPKKEKAPKSKPEVKRKAPQNAAVNSSKKQKFEKKGTQPKLFKKK